MSVRDLYSQLAAVTSLASATQSDPAVPVNGSGVDLANYSSAVVVFDAGTLTGSSTPTITPQIQESDDDVTYTAVAAADLDGGVLPAIVAANDASLYLRGYRGNKRYLRVAITAKGGTSPALPCAAVIVRGHARVTPAS